MMTRKIKRNAIQQLLNEGANLTLVEALPREHFEQGHLPGAIQINYDEVEEKAPKLLPAKEARIVVYCASETCQSSTKVAESLVAMGYTDVSRYEEGKKDWLEHGLPVEGAAVSR
ncbi:MULTISPECIES: rhodanese-like domain-containing protein [unclassified Nitrospina]|uniref:rhodanese-like domain-containing protein n=1 Tax=unclassified Nitrospina TaxID=2638683 RepID=UPI003F94EF09